MPFITILAIVFFTIGLRALPAEVWVRGAAVGLESSGEVDIRVPGEGGTYGPFDTPEYFPSVFTCEAQPAGSVFIRMSDQTLLNFRGAGFFSVERGESIYADLQAYEAGETAIRSHIILNMRRGELIIDSRQLNEDSKLLLETPFGRLTVDRSVLLVQIEFDHRSGIYDFTISTLEGKAQLYDLRRQTYLIYTGQRLSGAGSYFAPAIEVGEQMGSIREKFDAYFNRLKRLQAEQVDFEALRAQMKVLPAVALPDRASRLSLERSSPNMKRPRIIEYTPRAAPVTPYRAEIKPPSDYQADLF